MPPAALHFREQRRLLTYLKTHNDISWTPPTLLPSTSAPPLPLINVATVPDGLRAEQEERDGETAASGDEHAALPQHPPQQQQPHYGDEREALRLVGGMDISFVKSNPSMACAALVVLRFPSMDPLAAAADQAAVAGQDPLAAAAGPAGQESPMRVPGGEHAAGEQAAGEQAAWVHAAEEKAAEEKAAGEKAAGEKAAGKKAAGGRAAGENTAGDRGAVAGGSSGSAGEHTALLRVTHPYVPGFLAFREVREAGEEEECTATVSGAGR